MEGKPANKFMATVRKNWAAVPSFRTSLELKTSSPRSDVGVEERSADGDNV